MAPGKSPISTRSQHAGKKMPRISAHKKRYQCDFPGCNRRYLKTSVLRSHIKTHTGESPFICNWRGCGKAFRDSYTLAGHKKRTHTYETAVSCDWPGCGKQFGQTSDLTRHRRIHTGEKPYLCDWPDCGKRFPQPSQLNWHMRTHTREKRLAAV